MRRVDAAYKTVTLNGSSQFGSVPDSATVDVGDVLKANITLMTRRLTRARKQQATLPTILAA